MLSAVPLTAVRRLPYGQQPLSIPERVPFFPERSSNRVWRVLSAVTLTAVWQMPYGQQPLSIPERVPFFPERLPAFHFFHGREIPERMPQQKVGRGKFLKESRGNFLKEVPSGQEVPSGAFFAKDVDKGKDV